MKFLFSTTLQIQCLTKKPFRTTRYSLNLKANKYHTSGIPCGIRAPIEICVILNNFVSERPTYKIPLFDKESGSKKENFSFWQRTRELQGLFLINIYREPLNSSNFTFRHQTPSIPFLNNIDNMLLKFNFCHIYALIKCFDLIICLIILKLFKMKFTLIYDALNIFYFDEIEREYHQPCSHVMWCSKRMLLV